MKKVYIFLYAILISSSCYPFSGKGTGTLSDPYQITNYSQLNEIRNDLLSNYILINDIISDGTNFEPVTTSPDYPFKGTIDGKGKKIINLKIQTQKDQGALSYSSLIRYTGTSFIIQNIIFENLLINGSTNIGGICSYNNGKIVNCSVKGTILGTNFEGYGTQGGICAINNGIINRCYSNFIMTGFIWSTGILCGENNGTIDSCNTDGEINGKRAVGGLVGSNKNIIRNSFSKAIVKASDNSNDNRRSSSVGGLCGFNGGKIEFCYSTGNVVTDGDQIGGFCGNNSGGTIYCCYSSGHASGNKNTGYGVSDEIGGFCGTNGGNGTIEKCYSYGDASGIEAIGGFIGRNESGIIKECFSIGNAKVELTPDSQHDYSDAGGFCGINLNESCKISNCYSSGNAIGFKMVGGFSGRNNGSIENSYCSGKPTANANRYLGGFCGISSSNSYNSCYWDKENSGISNAIGEQTPDPIGIIGKTTSEMKKKNTFQNWNFSGIWTINEGQDYPRLEPCKSEICLRIVSPVSNTIKVTRHNAKVKIRFRIESGSVPINDADIMIKEGRYGYSGSIGKSINGIYDFLFVIPENAVDGKFTLCFYASKSGYTSCDSVCRDFEISRIKLEDSRKDYKKGISPSDEQDAMGLCPTKSIIGNGKLTAGLSHSGKLVSLYYPSPGYYNHIPYQTKRVLNDPINDESEFANFGAPEWLGSFAGIEVDGEFSWLSNGDWDVNMKYLSESKSDYGTPMIVNNYSHKTNPDWQVVETCFVHPTMDVIVRHFKFIGYGENIKFTYWGDFNPNNKNQTPPLYDKNGNEIPLNFIIGWQFTSNPTQAYIKDINNQNKPHAMLFKRGLDQEYTIAIAGSENGEKSASLPENIKVGSTLGSLWLIDPMMYTRDFGPDYTKGVESQEEIHNRNSCGSATWNLQNTKEITIYLSVGENEANSIKNLNLAISSGVENLKTQTKDYWSRQSWRSKIDNISSKLTEEQRKYFKNWVMTMSLLVDKNKGGIIASPNYQPKYYPMWPRDAIYQLIVWELLDEKNIVKKSIQRMFEVSEQFLLYKYWFQNYSLDGSYQGIPFINSVEPYKLKMIEEDQMPTVLWFIGYCWEKHKNDAQFMGDPKLFLYLYFGLKLDDYRNLADYVYSRRYSLEKYLVDIRFGTYQPGKIVDLLEPSFDIVEWHQGDDPLGAILNGFINPDKASITQSLYTNSAAVAGLSAATAILGDEKYITSAKYIKSSISTNLTNKSDNTFYWANVCLGPGPCFINDRPKSDFLAVAWPFSVFSQSDNRIKEYRDKIYKRVESNEDFFMSQWYYNLMYDYQNDIPKTGSGLNGIIVYIKKYDGEDFIGYVPERIKLNDPSFKKGARPLGWAQAFGALACLYEISPDYFVKTPFVNSVQRYQDIDNTIFQYTSVNYFNESVDFALVRCPVTIMAVNDKKDTIGISSKGEVFRKDTISQILTDSIGAPMALVLQPQKFYKIYLFAHDTGSFKFHYWKSMEDASVKFDFRGSFQSKNCWAEFNVNYDSIKAGNLETAYLLIHCGNNIDTIIPEVKVTGIIENKWSNNNFTIKPNPSNQSSRVHIKIENPSVVNLKITDLFGRTVKILINNKFVLNLDDDLETGDLPPGVYFVTLQAGSYVETKKFVVIK